MKVRIGFALGGGGMLRLDDVDEIIEGLDRNGFDSVWLPETFLAGTLDPLVGLAYAAARSPRLKIGSHFVAPGRNPISIAKSLAQLDRLSKGRLLLVFVAGLADPAERRAQGFPTGDRTVWFDDNLAKLRGWWSGEEVDGLRLDARPLQDPLEVWLGGQSASALQRVGAIGDGWIPGRITREAAVQAREVIERAASEAGRSISPEHYGINIGYTLATEPPAAITPDARDVVAVGVEQLHATISRWVEVGFTKVVVRPLAAPVDWTAELRGVAEAVLDLQT